jgi:hypothetical protein
MPTIGSGKQAERSPAHPYIDLTPLRTELKHDLLLTYY